MQGVGGDQRGRRDEQRQHAADGRQRHLHEPMGGIVAPVAERRRLVEALAEQLGHAVGVGRIRRGAGQRRTPNGRGPELQVDAAEPRRQARRLAPARNLRKRRPISRLRSSICSSQSAVVAPGRASRSHLVSTRKTGRPPTSVRSPR